MSEENLLEEFEVIELKDVVEEQKVQKPNSANEVELARAKLAQKLKILKEQQLEQKLEREQIKRGLDELKKSNDEIRKREELSKKEQKQGNVDERTKKMIEAKQAKFDDYEKARRAELQKYVRRYKEHSETSPSSERRKTSELFLRPWNTRFAATSSDEALKILDEERVERKIRRAKSERHGEGEENMKKMKSKIEKYKKKEEEELENLKIEGSRLVEEEGEVKGRMENCKETILNEVD